MIKPKWDMGMDNHIDKPYDYEDEVDPVDRYLKFIGEGSTGRY